MAGYLYGLRNGLAHGKTGGQAVCVDAGSTSSWWRVRSPS